MPLSHHHTSSPALKTRQLRARTVLEALISAPRKGDTVSYTPRGRSRQLPTAAAGARMSFHWPRGALLIQTWLAFRANTYLPWGQQPAWEEPNCYESQDSRAGEGTEGLGQSTSAQKHFSPSNSVQTPQENTASQPAIACPCTHLHSRLHAPGTHSSSSRGRKTLNPNNPAPSEGHGRCRGDWEAWLYSGTLGRGSVTRRQPALVFAAQPAHSFKALPPTHSRATSLR